MSHKLSILLGPGTRLASALLSVAGASCRWLGVAPDAEAVEVVSARHPSLPLIEGWQPDLALDVPAGPVNIFCCALGPIHAQAPALSRDAGDALRDLHISASILARCAPYGAHIVFVSSILALCPRRARAYYAGWKNVTETALLALGGQRDGLVFSVLYPGRLVDEEAGILPRCIHTPYRRLAKRMLAVAETGVSCRRLAGIDARLLLMARGLGFGLTALRGRLAAPSATRRPEHHGGGKAA